MLPNCVACGCSVDALRSCYSGRFYYGPGEGDFLRAGYFFANPAADHLDGPNPYGSALWLDEWNRLEGFGDRYLDVEYSRGESPSEPLFDRRRSVFPLRSDCESSALGIVLGQPQTFGIPNVCYIGGPPVVPSNQVTITDLNFTEGLNTRNISGSLNLEWFPFIGAYFDSIVLVVYCWVYFDPVDDFGSPNVTVIVEVTDEESFFVYFTWSATRADLEAGYTITSDPETVEGVPPATFNSLGSIVFEPFDFSPN